VLYAELPPQLKTTVKHHDLRLQEKENAEGDVHPKHRLQYQKGDDGDMYIIGISGRFRRANFGSVGIPVSLSEPSWRIWRSLRACW